LSNVQTATNRATRVKIEPTIELWKIETNEKETGWSWLEKKHQKFPGTWQGIEDDIDMQSQ
jgi:hypothetical protein